MKSIRANGLEIHYRELGQGPPLVLLHGGTLTSGSWASHLPIFAERFRVLAPDSRGHGKTRNPAGHLSYRQMADDIAAFIEALGLEKPMVLGYSDGGQVALELGLHYPELTDQCPGHWRRLIHVWISLVRDAEIVGIRRCGKCRCRPDAEDQP